MKSEYTSGVNILIGQGTSSVGDKKSSVNSSHTQYTLNIFSVKLLFTYLATIVCGNLMFFNGERKHMFGS